MSPGLPPRRTDRFVAVALACLVLLSSVRLHAAGLVDPRLHFKQARTPHFVIYFHQGEERLAARLASLVEPARLDVGRALGVEPPMLTHVILVDQSEQANGWATPLPRNTILLHAAAPSGADFIGRTADWLRLVFVHEYTHIAHLDRSAGWARVARGLLGRNGIAFPNMWLPQWQIEGLATFEESAIAREGRQYAGDFRNIERLAAASGRPLTLDRSSGGLVRWPDGHAAYAAGLGFHEYLVNRFGQAALGTLASATSSRLPFLGTRAYRSVFGEPLGTLWREYNQQLRPATTGAPLDATATPRRLTERGQWVAGPRFLPPLCSTCPQEIAYAARRPDEFPSLRRVGLAGDDDRRLATRYFGSTTGSHARFVVFDQQEIRRSVGLYSELLVLDRASSVVVAVPGTDRLQDPDVSPEGRRVAAVRERGGRRDLVVLTLGAELGSGTPSVASIETLASGEETQFSTPRWSPDGTAIAVERRQLGALPDIVVIAADSGQVRVSWSDHAARIVTPAWRPDGTAVIAAADFDGGPFDLYEFALADAGHARRLTRTDGALWPDVSADGSQLVFAGYSADGFDVFSTPYRPGEARLLQPTLASTNGAVTPLTSRPYSPLGTLTPTFWTPYAVADADQVRLGATVSGADVLARHAWALTTSWAVSAPTVVRPAREAVPDWSASYAYARWRPTIFSSASSQTLFRQVVASGATATVDISGTEREFQAGVHVPFVHVRRRAQLLASAVRTETTFHLSQRDRSTRVTSGRVALAFDSSQSYGYSVSRERGVLVGATIETTRRAFGSDGNATTTTLDLRGYAPGLERQHVLALRAAAGISRGDDGARQTFTMGAFGASPSVIDFSSGALGLLRSLPRTRAGDQLVVGNVEYRWPLARVERGIGTFPLMLRSLHAAVFGDIGQLKGTPERAPRGWSRGFGGELSADAVAGYGLPFAVTAGMAWGHDAGQATGPTVYARIGRSF